jgi:KDO2-lipid IV(A) lauroyltransferase
MYILPLRVAREFGALCGRIAYWVLPHYRRVALENLNLAFGGHKTKREIRRVARRGFENLGKNAAELLHFPKITRENLDRFVKIEGIDKLNRALKLGKGVLIVTGHIGNWELLALTIRLKGYHGAVIGRRIYFEKYDAYLNRLRGHHDIEVIYRDDSPKKILRVLKANGIIGILADQDVDSVDGVFVDFFGRRAYTPSGPVALARSSGAVLIPGFIIRENEGHRLVLEDPLKLVDTGDKEKDLLTNTQLWSGVIEAHIRRYPEQWVWMHRRWKTTPP